MSMPTFDWANLFRGVKSLAIRATFSNVGIVISIAIITGSVLGLIVSLFSQFVYPIVDLSSLEVSLNQIASDNTVRIFAYCMRLDLLGEFIQVWLSFVFGLITFLFTTLLTFYVGYGAIRIKQAIRADTKDL